MQIVAFGALIAAANAGLLHGHASAISSQSIIRHDEGHYAAPIAYSAPLAHAAPLAYAPVAYAAPAAHYEHEEYVSKNYLF